MPTPTKPDFTRPALAPGLLGAVALVAGVALLDTGAFIIFRYVVSIFALIMIVFAFRARAWWAIVLLAAIAVLWNPVVVIPLDGQPWAALQFVAAFVFIVVGVLVKVPTERTTS
ncbi:DUF6804 family protein [Frigoribacterium sp. 2-23]|uniref:DUF6804 family protein n=1 Tax=Frigoribacterium sp. 2-23 TaxID=3415006 RepID=UPI003C6FD3B7